MSSSTTLATELTEALPPLAAYLGPARVTDLAQSGARADALAYASLIQPGKFSGEEALRALGPLWQEVLSARRRREVPPLANLGLLARLVREPPEPIDSFLGSEAVYLLPYQAGEALDDDWVDAAATEIGECLQGDPWYPAALFARAAPYLSDDQRSQITNASRPSPHDWPELYKRISVDGRWPWTSTLHEVERSHPALSQLRRFAEHSSQADLTAASAQIIRDMNSHYGDPALRRWEPTPPEPQLHERGPLIIRPDLEEPDQVRLSAAGDDIGRGERIQLPGMSTRYRLLEFFCPRCTQPQPQYRIYYDEEDLPVCPDHGQMELRR